jgi:UDP-N-acetylglucosamine:LPS N-acetylglucosamine transferase
MGKSYSGIAPRKKILVTLAGGGYLWEVNSLLKSLEMRVECCYATGDDTIIPSKFRDKEVYLLKTINSIQKSGYLGTFARLIYAIGQALWVMGESKPDAVVCLGTSLAVPLSLSAKIFGKKAIFIESITRVHSPSLTGRILAALRLVDRHYVQWPEATAMYKRAVYKGTVL